MGLNIYTGIDSCFYVLRKIKEYRSEDSYNHKADLLAHLNRMWVSEGVTIVLHPKEQSEMRDKIAHFIKIISDRRSKGIEFSSKVFNLISRRKDAFKGFGGEPSFIFKHDSENSYFYQSSYQIQFLDHDNMINKWDKLAQFTDSKYPKIFLFNAENNFKWEKLSVFNEPTRSIIVVDPFLFSKENQVWKNNILKAIKVLMPDLSQTKVKLRITFIASKKNANNDPVEMQSILDLIKSELNEEQLTYTLALLDDEYLHDRHIMTDNFCFECSTSFDFLDQNEKVKRDSFNYSLRVTGMGSKAEFVALRAKCNRYLTVVNEEIDSADGYVFGNVSRFKHDE
jgi:hypothetical protein